MKRFLLFLIFVLCADVCVAGVSDAPRKSEFEKALKVVLTTVAPQTPIAAVDDRIKKYEDMQANKGLAIEPITSRFWRSQSHEDRAVAGARTLEGCQLRYGRPCALIAVNEEIVLEGPLVPKDMARLHYAGKSILRKFP